MEANIWKQMCWLCVLTVYVDKYVEYISKIFFLRTFIVDILGGKGKIL